MLSTHTNFFQQKLTEAVQEHWLLVECFFVALSLHVVLIPILWVISWTLPWPRSPVVTTVIEYELDKSDLIFKPKQVNDYIDPKLNPK